MHYITTQLSPAAIRPLLFLCNAENVVQHLRVVIPEQVAQMQIVIKTVTGRTFHFDIDENKPVLIFLANVWKTLNCYTNPVLNVWLRHQTVFFHGVKSFIYLFINFYCR